MKRLKRTCFLTASILVLVWFCLPKQLSIKLPVVETISPIQETVYESVSCTGVVRASKTYRLNPGIPMEILEVYVAEGDVVATGQAILSYRLLEDEEISSALYMSEWSEQWDEMVGYLQGESILLAAEYFAANGELPSYFEGFYLPRASESGQQQPTEGILISPMSGTVTSLYCERGEHVSGVFPLAVIEDTADLVASLRAPERVLSKLSVGLPVNISGDAFGDSVFSGRVLSIGPHAITTGGILSKQETYIEVTSSINTQQSVMSGLTIRGTIFFTMFEDAVIVPYEAIAVDSEGNEFVYRCQDGYLVKTQLRILHETERGVVCDGSISASDTLVKHPSDTLTNGLAVTILAETEAEP